MENPNSKIEDYTKVLLISKHTNYIKTLDDKTDSFEYWVTEHLKLNGVYWGLAAMDVLKSLHEMNKDKIVEFILSCQHTNGGFGGNVGHDPHLLYTLSAVQVLCMLQKIDKIEVNKVANYVGGLQREDGSFQGDEWGEIDTRFSYCAVSCLSLLDAYNRSSSSSSSSKQDPGYLDTKIDRKKAIEFVLKCKNFDGGFGCIPGAESHGAYIFCCIGALKILAGENLGMKENEIDRLAWWLSERQLPQGGLNGRPEKLPDVCYSWWVVSTLGMINRIHWIDTKKLEKFILECQDEDNGGIGDRPGDVADVFHTFFGVAGLSLVGYRHPNNLDVLNQIDPCYALCKSTLASIGL